MHLYYPIITQTRAGIPEVGGKGYSLMRLAAAGLPVPPGFILTTGFFEFWLRKIKSAEAWNNYLTAREEDISVRCEVLQAFCLNLDFTLEQAEIFSICLDLLPAEVDFFAVRSSSPQEDLENASFAGEYRTLLGMNRAQLEDAIRQVFASAFSPGIFFYKRVHNFDPENPDLAVIVQAQVQAETAGVVFSLNPINNCYDEAVINANYGLGESVVSGAVTPDSFVVDKVKKQILVKNPGKKEIVLRQAAGGGTREEAALNPAQFCLSDTQVLQLAGTAIEVETFYGKPVDLEWAFAPDGELRLLQARPVTAYFPLPEPLLTEPGRRKRLYLDSTLTKQGLQQPVSVLGSIYSLLITEKLLGQHPDHEIRDTVENGLLISIHGRMYLNISNRLRITGKKRIAAEYRIIDPVAAEILAAIDEKEYKAGKFPKHLFRLPLKTIGMVLKMVNCLRQVLKSPIAYKKRLLAGISEFRRKLAEPGLQWLPLREYIDVTGKILIELIFMITIPVTYATMITKPRIMRLFKKASPGIRALAGEIDRSMPENITIEMGLCLYRLSRFPEIRDSRSADEFQAGLAAGRFSPEFQTAWNEFMEKYGFRGAGEIDIAAPRYRDQPLLVFAQLKAMSINEDPLNNPELVYERSQAERQKYYEQLKLSIRGQGQRAAARFERYYRILLEYGGWREIHKYYIVMLNNQFRQRVLETGHNLAAADRLDNPAQVFELTLDQITAATENRIDDLRQLVAENTAYRQKYRGIRHYPRIIDSRGKILLPPAKEHKPGELAGEPISPGKISGPVKVLHYPAEKPLLPGEILVARATDPGWTPLFINAGGIILEIGGTLQHGACVAREYGKPCVSAIEGAVEILRDGQMVELDGTTGIVKLLGDHPSLAVLK